MMIMNENMFHKCYNHDHKYVLLYSKLLIITSYHKGTVNSVRFTIWGNFGGKSRFIKPINYKKFTPKLGLLINIPIYCSEGRVFYTKKYIKTPVRIA